MPPEHYKIGLSPHIDITGILIPVASADGSAKIIVMLPLKYSYCDRKIEASKRQLNI